MENNIKVKLLICYHKPDKLFKDEILTPIHVGRAQAKRAGNPNLAWLEENMIGDDTGENISLQNYCYNELTAPYWAWKNYESLGDPDYIGLMHYRRHFIFDPAQDMGVVHYDGMNDYYLDSIRYTPENVRALVAQNDIVYYKGRVDNIYKHYFDNHKIEDLELALQIVKELHPADYATAQKYVHGDIGCFCNMAIFSKALFFEYCEWLFPILETFFERVDMSEKRFFISERLTGIFIEKKIAEGARALPLATSFVKTEYRIPVVIPFDKNRIYETAVTMQSFIHTANADTHIDFHILTDGIEEESKASIDSLIADRPDFTVKYDDIGAFCRENGIEDVLGKKELYPFLLGDALRGIGKCFYVTQDVLIMKDIEEFFRLCSVDDFWIVGAGEKAEQGVTWFGSSCVINTKRLTDHKVFDLFRDVYQTAPSLSVLANTICKDQISIYPSWFWVNAGTTAGLIPTEGKRADLQTDALWHTMICYTKETNPTQNIQATYSVFWWNIAQTLSGNVVFDIHPDTAVASMDADQIVLNSYKKKDASTKRPPNELSMTFKAKRFYKQFGFKATVRRCFEKLFGR